MNRLIAQAAAWWDGRTLRERRMLTVMGVAIAVAEVGAATGLTPQMGMSAEGGLGFSLTNVSTTAAFGWLAALHDRKVEATTLNVVENADATISLEGTLTAAR